MAHIVCKVDQLIQQVQFKNRQVRSILCSDPRKNAVHVARDVASDADSLLLEAVTLNAKVENLKKASELAERQVQMLLIVSYAKTNFF